MMASSGFGTAAEGMVLVLSVSTSINMCSSCSSEHVSSSASPKPNPGIPSKGSSSALCSHPTPHSSATDSP
jgi:hypothetical protein